MPPAEVFNALPAGYTLQEYRIEAMLGVGGFGLTYLAHDANLNTKVAIKAGKPLNEWVKERSTLDQAGLTRIAAPLLDGLEVIHQAGYLHRDVKPQNIFMREDGSPVLIDFGSARMKVSSDQELTAIVTPGFAPFEQYHTQGKQGPWTDLYSLAGVLYWLATGNKPVEAAARVREDVMPSAFDSGERKYYSAEFLSAIDWALKPHEQNRPQSVAEWRAALVGGGIVAAHERTVMVGQPASRPAPVETVSSSSMPTGVVFDRATLKRIETELAAHLGPIANVMLKSAARKATTVPALAELLAREISDEKARTAFVRKFRSDDSMPVSHPPQGTQSVPAVTAASISATTLQRFSAETLQRAESTLARHIGAVAKVVVKRAAQKARDESELYLLLADEIEDKAEKKNFIRRAISVSGKE